MQNRFTDYRAQLRLFLIPYLLGTFLLFVIPALATIAIAFTDYNTLRPPVWVGLGNFLRIFQSDITRLSLRSSLIFVALAVPLRLLAAFGMALLLQGQHRLFGVYRSAVYLPTVIPEAAYALIWLWIFNPLYGPLNAILSWSGLPAPAWLAQEETARLAIVIVATFQMGEGFIVLLAGLQNIPRALYEAAKVDGAGGWQMFLRITLPLMLPWLLLLTFRDLIMSLQNSFTPSFVMTYGGPYYATTFVPLLIYELAFDLRDLGLASAITLLIYVASLLAILVMVRAARGRLSWES